MEEIKGMGMGVNGGVMGLLSEYNQLQNLVEDMFRLFNLLALQKIESFNEIASELERICKKYPKFNLEPHH